MGNDELKRLFVTMNRETGLKHEHTELKLLLLEKKKQEHLDDAETKKAADREKHG